MSLGAEYSTIQAQFGIGWQAVRWQDLRRPLYSGIAAALYTKLHGSVGWRIENQAEFYQQYFKPAAGNNFTQLANILDLGKKLQTEQRLMLSKAVPAVLQTSRRKQLHIAGKYFRPR